MARFSRWAALRYARLIAEVKRDTEVSTAIEETSNATPTASITQTDIDTAIANLVSSAPETLNTLDELSNALGDDANFATSVTTSLGNKANTSMLSAYLEDTDVDYSISLTQQGTLAVTTGTARWYAPYNLATNSIKSYVETAPVGSAINITVNKNGTSAATPSISAGATTSTEITSPITMSEGDYLTVDITSVGSTTAGENLNIVFKYKRT